MSKLVLLGDEAIAQAGIDAGMSGIYAYPGTPSTEIMEYVQSSKQAGGLDIHREWSANEKTAMEAALGMSYAGKRAMVCMKHVGLNVAADGFINAAMTGVNGGLIVVSADDPSMHSSQNEQDSRFYGKFAMIPIFEPSSQQECYDMVFEAFRLSEEKQVPVLFRITTRLAHSRSGVEKKAVMPQNKMKMPEDPRQFVLLPAIARKRYKKLLAAQKEFLARTESSRFNSLMEGKDKNLGIITTGIAYNYLMECYPEGAPYSVLKICEYPIPEGKVREITESCEKVLVLEEGFPFVEEQLRGLLNQGKPVLGRLDGTVPRDGELNPNIVARALGLPDTEGPQIPDLVQARPPALCKGCSHADMYNALNEAMEPHGPGKVFSDIGCYTLGALPPYNAIYSCVDMGASVTMAIGAADAGVHPSVCVIGDSTFTHSGMTGLLDAVNKNSPITLVISDNSTTGMTGGQKSSGTGRLENICLGLGVEKDHLIMMNPLRKYHQENVDIFKKELDYKGVSVIIAQRECIQTASRRKRREAAAKKMNA